MKRLHNFAAASIFLLYAWCVSSGTAGGLASWWQHEQDFTITSSGLVKLSLPIETLDSARPGLEDLRIYDASGAEVPYWIAHPAPAVREPPHRAKSFHTTLRAKSSVLVVETGVERPINGIKLESPGRDFIKPVRIEGSRDLLNWQPLSDGQPIFSQPDGAAQLHLSFPAGAWAWLRLTVDDQRSPPVPWTGAALDVVPPAAEPEATEWMNAPIAERHENPDETRLSLNLGAANLELEAVRIVSDTPLFARQVSMAVAVASEYSIAEQTLGRGTIFRVAVEGAPASENLTIPFHAQIRSRQLLLLIKNGDSPPLSIKSVQVERRPVYVVFLANQTGLYQLLTGNAHCSAPAYDLSGLHIDPKSLPVAAVTMSPPAENPGYKAPEVLPGVTNNGAALDVSVWEFRKPVKMGAAGVQQLEIDFDALAHAQPGLRDLRLLRDGKQIPFVVENTSITRSISLTATAGTDPKEPSVTRWTIQLPPAGLPASQLACAPVTALFHRDVELYQFVEDERGEKVRRPIAQGGWMQTPEHTNREFILQINDRLSGDRIYLETRNGDNPPIELKDFHALYPVSRILFKPEGSDGIYLYYGNRMAAPPQYDLSLVGSQLLAADKSTASLGEEERLKAAPHARSETSGMGTVALWGILSLVVVVLLWLIARLLPKSPPPPAT